MVSDQDENSIRLHFDWERFEVGRALTTFATTLQVEAVSMPWANHLAPKIDFPFAQRFPIMRAGILHSLECSIYISQANPHFGQPYQSQRARWHPLTGLGFGFKKFEPGHPVK
jgi:hypothetical protein